MSVATSTSVTVELDRDPKLVRVARLAARSMASDAGFHLEDLEDLSLGIDELAACAIAAMRDGARLRMHIEVDDLGLSARGIIVGDADDLAVDDLARSVLDGAVDRWAVNDKSVAFRLVKIRPGLI